MAYVFAGEDRDEASLAIYHAKRFPWKAQVEGVDRLEQALGELEEAMKKAGVGDG